MYNARLIKYQGEQLWLQCNYSDEVDYLRIPKSWERVDSVEMRGKEFDVYQMKNGQYCFAKWDEFIEKHEVIKIDVDWGFVKERAELIGENEGVQKAIYMRDFIENELRKDITTYREKDLQEAQKNVERAHRGFILNIFSSIAQDSMLVYAK